MIVPCSLWRSLRSHPEGWRSGTTPLFVIGIVVFRGDGKTPPQCCEGTCVALHFEKFRHDSISILMQKFSQPHIRGGRRDWSDRPKLCFPTCRGRSNCRRTKQALCFWYTQPSCKAILLVWLTKNSMKRINRNEGAACDIASDLPISVTKKFNS